ncbi:MAG: S-layer homology domain-containing protein [Clostridia bacterium]|nr:S-layer homology domain-containing protein [Clostridia bacterium]
MKKLFAMAVAFVLLLTFIPAYAEEAVVTNMVIDGVEVTSSGDLTEAEMAEIIAAIKQAQQEEAEPEEEKTTYPDVAGTEYEEAAKTMENHKVMMGYPDGSFRPYENLSRAELVVVLSRLMSVAHVAKTMKAEKVFDDVSDIHWAAREIQLVSDKDVLSGYGDNTFHPEEYVTYAQTAKMMVEMLGYGENAVKKGGYPLGYLVIANELGIPEGTNYKNDELLTRGMAAKLLANVLYIPKTDGKILADTMKEMYYFVSPRGDDKNPGTEEKPWKTAEMAGKTATAGTTVIFEDGEYNETNITTVKNSGEKGAPITFKARNKQKAVLKYCGDKLVAKQKFTMKNVSYINVRDLSFTQEKKATDSTQSATADIFLNASSSSHLEFTGNKFWNIYEEGIKLTYVDRFLLEDNEVIESDHEGFDVFCSSNGIVRNNRWINCGRVSYMNKGNSYNNLVYNNYAYYNITLTGASNHAMGIGGSSNSQSPRDIGKGTGWEAYNCVYFNNVIISEVPGGLPIGLYFTGCRDCHAYNNIVVGAKQAVQTRATLGLSKGWEWDPPVVRPVLKNNIFVNCETGVYFWEEVEDPDFSNNIYYNVINNADKNAINENPRFVDLYTDWNLLADSKAIDAGVEIPDSIPGFDRPYNGEAVVEAIEIPKVDFNGNPRTGKWDLGIYNVD